MRHQKNFVRLPLEGVANCRDLGGYPTNNQQVIRWQSLIRSSDLGTATEADLAFLYDYGVRHIIDLRTPRELTVHPNPAKDVERIHYHHVSLLDYSALSQAEIKARRLQPTYLRDIYLAMIEEKTLLKEVLTIIAQSNPKEAVLFHCSGGKDRTGIVAMLLLGLAGVSLQDIMTNYEVSYTNLTFSANQAALTDIPMNTLGSNPENIKQAYQHVLAHYGSFEGYFEALGFSAAAIERVVQRLVE
ncbi:tyrosine-protein phosphatase [Fundicoccus culcitae]|uniref:Tyrosine-protein phosphatase n=1 Tax=Fundicoccus culcitae TaxID=2969821 RepID=A0ABY5P4I9_9LACT|nr:tyrosine-protein phosphatase [Fundicoccus culcitae]UUX33464.1 tyrosine-protein phosphatase [Fundicoccus culcitae]